MYISFSLLFFKGKKLSVIIAHKGRKSHKIKTLRISDTVVASNFEKEDLFVTFSIYFENILFSKFKNMTPMS